MLIRRIDRFYPGEFGDIARAARRGELIDGPAIAAFEAAFARFVGTRYAVATSSGVSALTIILSFLDLRPGDEVIIPTYTSKVVVKPFKAMGIDTVFCDIDPATALMDPDRLESSISGRAKAVLPTHLFGRFCDMRLFDIARRRGLYVIEDCAHAHGCARGGKKAGAAGDAAFFSFDYCKLINTFMGGMITTNDAKLAAFARDSTEGFPRQSAAGVIKRGGFSLLLSSLLASRLNDVFYPLLTQESLLRTVKKRLDEFSHGDVLASHRYTNVQSLVGMQQLAQLEAFNSGRLRAARRIEAGLRGRCSFITTREGDVIYYLIAIVDDAARFKRHMLRHGIDVGIGESIMNDVSVGGGFPGAAYAVDHYSQIPVPAQSSSEDTDRIIRAMEAYARTHQMAARPAQASS